MAPPAGLITLGEYAFDTNAAQVAYVLGYQMCIGMHPGPFNRVAPPVKAHVHRPGVFQPSRKTLAKYGVVGAIGIGQSMKLALCIVLSIQHGDPGKSRA